MSRGDWVSLAYIVTIVSFILALRFLSDPAQGAARQPGRRRRHGHRHRGDVLPARPRLRPVRLGDHRHGRHSADRRLRRARREDDGDAADGGAVQRRRRRRGGLDRPRGLPRLDRGAGRPRSQRLRRHRPLGAHRLGVVRGQHGRFREAPGADDRPADHVSRPEVRQSPAARGAGRPRHRHRRRRRVAKPCSSR